MDKFIQKLNFDFITNQRYYNSLATLTASKGKWNIAEKTGKSLFEKLRKIATIESIGSSTRIEGATLTNQEVKELLKDNLKSQH